MTTSVEQIAVELGRSTPAVNSVQFEQWSQWVADAETIIANRLGPVAALDAATVDLVTRLAVAEHARNPEGVDTYDVSVDDARTSKRYRHSSGRIVIRDEWWSWLSPDSGGSVFSVRMDGERDVPPLVVW